MVKPGPKPMKRALLRQVISVRLSPKAVEALRKRVEDFGGTRSALIEKWLLNDRWP